MELWEDIQAPRSRAEVTLCTSPQHFLLASSGFCLLPFKVCLVKGCKFLPGRQPAASWTLQQQQLPLWLQVCLAAQQRLLEAVLPVQQPTAPGSAEEARSQPGAGELWHAHCPWAGTEGQYNKTNCQTPGDVKQNCLKSVIALHPEC